MSINLSNSELWTIAFLKMFKYYNLPSNQHYSDFFTLIQIFFRLSSDSMTDDNDRSWHPVDQGIQKTVLNFLFGTGDPCIWILCQDKFYNGNLIDILVSECKINLTDNNFPLLCLEQINATSFCVKIWG